MGKKRRKKLARAARPSGTGAPAKAPKLGRWAPLVLVLLPLLIYANSLNNAFHYDDFHSLVDNPHVRELKNIPSFFASTRTTSLRAEKGHYRPVLFSTYALSYALGGYDYDPRMFRVFNLVFHILNGLLVFAVFRSILRSPASSGTEDGRLFGNTAAAFFAALLFAVHPLNTESVNYISCRSNAMAATFFLAGVWLFVWYSGSAPARRRTALYAGSLGCFVLGLLTKEIVITLPAILVLLDILVLNPGARPLAYKALFRRHAAYWMVAALHIFLVFAVGLKPMYEPRGVFYNLLIQTKAMAFYLRLLVFPRGLSISHGFDMEMTLSAAFWVSLSVIGGILFLAWKLRERWGLLSFAILWYFITLLPTSSVLPLNIPVNEHRTYLPAVGFVVAVGFLLGLITTKSQEASARLRSAPASPRHMGASGGQALSKLVVPLFAVVIGVFSVTAFMRNQTWKMPTTIWEDAVKTYPYNHHAHYGLGNAYGKLGRYAEAVEAYKQSIRFDPYNADTHYNLGFAYSKLGRNAEAIEAFKQAIRLKPDMAEAHSNLGFAYTKLDRHAEAIEAYKHAILLKPDLAKAHL
ncbi:MAG: tetratricopeptide repeat protein, partial [Acidobacteriota bacterium]